MEQRDTAALLRTHLSRAEFAYLYYPEHPQARAPHPLPPDLMWLMIETRSTRAVAEMVAELDGGPSHLETVHCQSTARQGGARVYRGCRGTLRRKGGADEDVALGPIIERDGRFKFIAFGAGD